MFNRILGYLLTKFGLAIGAVAAILAMWWRAWSGGARRERERQEARRAAELAESQQRHIDDLRKLQETRDEVDALSDDDVHRRLRDRWTRPQDH